MYGRGFATFDYWIEVACLSVLGYSVLFRVLIFQCSNFRICSPISQVNLCSRHPELTSPFISLNHFSLQVYLLSNSQDSRRMIEANMLTNNTNL